MRSPELAETLADFALEVGFDDLPDEVVRTATSAIADTLACGIAAVDEEGPRILRQYALTRGSHPEATLLASGERVSAPLATLVNSTLVRDFDANDLYAGPPNRDTGHFSDAIPALLAAAEKTGATGREFLTAVVLAYELQAVLAEAYLWMRNGLHPVSQLAWAIPAAAGRLLGLSRAEIVSAIGLSGSTAGLVLQSWLKPTRAMSHLKGAAPGLVASRAVEIVELAALGLTGPDDALETLFAQVPSAAELSPFDRLRRPFRFTIQRTMVKRYPCQINIQAAVEAASRLHSEIGSVDNVANVAQNVAKVTVYSHHGLAAGVQGSPPAYAPETRAAADHSTPFAVAIALRDGTLTPASYRGQPWLDPELRELMNRIELVVDAEHFEPAYVEKGLYGCRISLLLRDGRELEATVDQQKGHPDNPLSRDDLLAKIREFVDIRLGKGMGDRLVGYAAALPDATNVSGLVAATGTNPHPSLR